MRRLLMRTFTPSTTTYCDEPCWRRRAFFGHLVEENLSVTNLIDSDFTFLNRRLAEHYGIEGIEGEQIRKVKLNPTSVRGGILTQASIAKVTANGTVTTPVKRGNFVLTNLLGLPPTHLHPVPVRLNQTHAVPRPFEKRWKNINRSRRARLVTARSIHRDLPWNASIQLATFELVIATVKVSRERSMWGCVFCTRITNWGVRWIHPV